MDELTAIIEELNPSLKRPPPPPLVEGTRWGVCAFLTLTNSNLVVAWMKKNRGIDIIAIQGIIEVIGERRRREEGIERTERRKGTEAKRENVTGIGMTEERGREPSETTQNGYRRLRSPMPLKWRGRRKERGIEQSNLKENPLTITSPALTDLSEWPFYYSTTTFLTHLLRRKRSRSRSKDRERKHHHHRSKRSGH